MPPPRRTMTALEFARLRRELNVTQWQIATYLGVSIRTVKAWERGERPLPTAACLALSQKHIRHDLMVLGGLSPPSWRQASISRRRAQFRRDGYPIRIAERET